MAFYRRVGHISLWRAAEHVAHSQVDWAHTVGLLKDKTMVAGGFSNHIERSAFALGNCAHPLNVFLLNHHAHTLLRLIADDFFRRQCRVAHRESSDFNFSACRLNEFRQSVQVSAGTVVVD